MGNLNKFYRYKKNGGFTLIEVIISVALLAILSLPILMTITTNIKISQNSSQSQQATLLGQRIIEYLGRKESITLENSLEEIGLSLSFSKLEGTDGSFSATAQTEDNLEVKLTLKKVIDNNRYSNNPSMNQLMKQPNFILEGLQGSSSHLLINGELMSPTFVLRVGDKSTGAQEVQLCQLTKDKTTKKCVKDKFVLDYQEDTMKNEALVTIRVKGELGRKFEIPVVNESRYNINIYVQLDQAQDSSNLKFDYENNSVNSLDTSVSYLSELPQDSLMENVSDLYEVVVQIKQINSKGALYESKSVLPLKIKEVK